MMTIAELIELLRGFPQDIPVMLPSEYNMDHAVSSVLPVQLQCN